MEGGPRIDVRKLESRRVEENLKVRKHAQVSGIIFPTVSSLTGVRKHFAYGPE